MKDLVRMNKVFFLAIKHSIKESFRVEKGRKMLPLFLIFFLTKEDVRASAFASSSPLFPSLFLHPFLYKKGLISNIFPFQFLFFLSLFPLFSFKGNVFFFPLSFPLGRRKKREKKKKGKFFFFPFLFKF